MRFETPPSPESRETGLAERLADKAMELASTWEWPHNLWKALDALGVKDPGERKTWFAKAAAELKRRKRVKRLAEGAASSESAKYEAEEREREAGEE